MATRRKKASTRTRAKQGGRATQTKRPSKVRPAKAAKRTKKTKSTVQRPAKKASGGRTTKKKASRQKAKPRKRARKASAKVMTPSLAKRVESGFRKLRSAALKKGKLVLPKFTRKKGKLRLRGTDGKERTLIVEDFWENLREGHEEVRANRAFESLWRDFERTPTLYARFTFTVTKVATLLTTGSPKLVRASKKKVMHWFFSTGLSYSLLNMRHQFQVGWDTLQKEITDVKRNNLEASFFLEYITCIAYTVKA